MSKRIADLLLARITAQGYTWIDKTAGLTRPIKFKKGEKDKPKTFPIGCDVVDPLKCDPGTLAELLPDNRYRSVMFFEGESMPRRGQATPADPFAGPIRIVRLRLIVWLNCELIGEKCGCGDKIQQNIISALENYAAYDNGTLRGIIHQVIGGGPTGAAIFGKYTFDQERSQYVHYPYDMFCIDVETSYRVKPGCEEEVTLDPATC